jgi:hypothetical protein
MQRDDHQAKAVVSSAGQRLRSAGLALAAALLLMADLATYPADLTTRNWTELPLDGSWQTLRLQWEYSHAVNAGLTLLAFICLVLAVLLAGPDRRR